jgi:hypothetical protein
MRETAADSGMPVAERDADVQGSAVLSRDLVVPLLTTAMLAGCGRLGYSADDDRPDASTAQPCAADEILCGDFEGNLGGWVARGNVGGGNRVELVTSPVAVGSHALFIRTDGSGDGFVAAEHYFAPVTSGTIHGRAMVWIGSATTVADFLVALQIDDGDDGGGQKISVDLLPGDALGLTATTPEPAVRPGAAEGTARRDDWMCMTFEIVVDPERGAAHFALDGELLVSIDGIDTVAEPGGFRRFLLAGVGPGPGVSELGFDAVSVGREPLACPP